MARIGNLYGPDATFLGVPAVDPDDVEAWRRCGALIIGAPFDGGTSHRPGCRFGPQAMRVDGLPASRRSSAEPGLGRRSLERAGRGGPRRRGDALGRDGAVPATSRRAGEPRGPAKRDPRRAGRGSHHRPSRRHRRRQLLRLRSRVGHSLRRPRRHGRESDGFALRTRHADEATHRIGRLSRGPLSTDRPARLLARARDAGLDGRPRNALVRDGRDRSARPRRRPRRSHGDRPGRL